MENLRMLKIPILGAVINRVGSHGEQGYYGYYSGYGYGYDYAYTSKYGQDEESPDGAADDGDRPPEGQAPTDQSPPDHSATPTTVIRRRAA